MEGHPVNRLPDYVDSDAEFELLPSLISGIHGCIQRHRQRQACSVAQRKTKLPSLRDQIAGNSGMLLEERRYFLDWAGGVFPRFVRAPSAAHKFALYFGQIHRTADGIRKQLGRESLMSRLSINQRKNGGGIEYDPPTHAWPRRGARRETRQRGMCRVLHAGGHGAERAQFDLEDSANTMAGALNSTLLGRDAQFVLLKSKHYFVSNVDAKSLPKRGGNHYSAVLADTYSGFFCHGTIQAL